MGFLDRGWHECAHMFILFAVPCVLNVDSVGQGIPVFNRFHACFWSTLMENTELYVLGSGLIQFFLQSWMIWNGCTYPGFTEHIRVFTVTTTALHNVCASSITPCFLWNILSLWRLQSWWVIFSAMDSPSVCQSPLTVGGKSSFLWSSLVNFVHSNPGKLWANCYGGGAIIWQDLKTLWV